MGKDEEGLAAQLRLRGGRMREERITLSHGSGGKATYALVTSVFAEAFSHPILEELDDAAVLPPMAGGEGLAFTTDGYTVTPWFFPGGDIGALAVHGTVNDLCMRGAEPRWLAAAFVLEEGFPLEDLRRIAHSMAAAARAAGVAVVAGDTKVVPRGKADGIFITTAGVGVLRRGPHPGQARAQVGDKVLVSGTMGDHGLAVLLAREPLGLDTRVQSDTAPLSGLVASLLAAAGTGVHCLKDPTRGGLATTLNEIALASRVCLRVREEEIPVRPEVVGACELLGLDPLTLANEGKLVAVVAPEVADAALAALRAHPFGRKARLIGEVAADPPGRVLLETRVGGTRVLDMPVGDPLPRIC